MPLTIASRPLKDIVVLNPQMMGDSRRRCALTDACEVQYKCTGVYNSKGEAEIYFADPEIGIHWPIDARVAITPKKIARRPGWQNGCHHAFQVTSLM